MQSIGKENFRKEILEFANSREELNILEAKYVTKEVIENPKCYNMITGGWQDDNPHILSNEALERRSNSIRVRYANDPELCNRISDNSKKCWQDPEYAEKCLAPLKRWTSEKELLAIKGKRISKTINDSEHKEKHLEQCLSAIAKGREVLKEKMKDVNYRRSDSHYIMCITTGEVFPCLKAAFVAHGSGHIMDVCLGIRKHTRDSITKQQLSWKFITKEEYEFKRKELNNVL